MDCRENRRRASHSQVVGQARGRFLLPGRSRPGRRASGWLSAGWLLVVASFFGAANSVDASEQWPSERRTGPFYWHADFPLEGYASLLSEMGALQQDLVRQLGVAPANEPVHLFLFHDKNTYQAYMRHYFPKVPFRRALYIKERGPGMVFAYRSAELEIDVRHESTHALLHSTLPMVPLWLDEGLAEYFEMPAARRPSEHPHLSSIKWHVRLGMTPRIETLEGLADLGQMGKAEYRDAWAWVHFMLHGPAEARDELIRFLADIQAHTPPGKLSERLRRRLPTLERDFSAHFKNWR